MRKSEALLRLKAHRDELWAKYPITRLGIFGSVARDAAGEDSDVDIVVLLTVPDIFILSSLRQDLVEILGTDVDLVRESQYLRPLLLQRIQQDVIYV